MKANRIRMMPLLILLMLCLCAIPGYAIEDASNTMSQSGNMELLDDIRIGDKELLTVMTRDQHSFYIIIDRSAEHKTAVHFLNQVDEIDLFAILNEEETENPLLNTDCCCSAVCKTGSINTDCYVCLYNMTECTAKEVTPTADEQKSDFDIASFLIIAFPLLVYCVIIGYKEIQKQSDKKNAEEAFDLYDSFDEPRENED